MVFSSISFIYIFLPLFLITYYRAKYKNLVLFVGSMIFYMAGSYQHPVHIFIFLMCLVVNFLVGRQLQASNHKTMWFVVGITYNVCVLFCFKYMSFVLKETMGINRNILLPIGISFYTFQAISYLCDVHREKCKAEDSLVDFGTYFTMFPQLIAGPIVTYPSVKKELHHRQCGMKQFIEGSEVFIIGLGSKLLLANQIAGLWRQVKMIGYESVSIPLAWMGIFAYSFQLYFDFLGYSLMAIGLGRMLGFRLPKNFNYPYISVSMTEFWRRWHITLGSWFRDYIYIPLGGNRKGVITTFRNLLIIWMLTGIWHGAGYNYLLWGFVLFLLIAIEKLGLKHFMDRHRIVGHIYMLFAIPLTWAIFVNSNWNQLIVLFYKLFGFMSSSSVLFSRDYVKYGSQYGWILVCCFLFSTPYPRRLYKKCRGSVVYYIVLLAIFCGAAYCLWMGMNDPFLYFQF